ncbi:MAG: hypothetical protein HY675_17430 [Chloroflexi bacterium]|nr:hypothetical protein [Chloroflexota bacterium]
MATAIQPTPTRTPRPTATPRPARPTAVPKPTLQPPRAVPEVEGQWVTSRAANARNYYRKSDPRWRDLAERNRVWFKTLEDLLAAYPNRRPPP